MRYKVFKEYNEINVWKCDDYFFKVGRIVERVSVDGLLDNFAKKILIYCIST